MPTQRQIRLAWRPGIGSNPLDGGQWFDYSHDGKLFLQMLVETRCRAHGEGSHWIEERCIEDGPATDDPGTTGRREAIDPWGGEEDPFD